MKTLYNGKTLKRTNHYREFFSVQNFDCARYYFSA